MTDALRLLITGANGFLGSALSERAGARRFDVAKIVRVLIGTEGKVIGNSYLPRDIADSLNGFKPDVIIHAAGASSVTRSVENPESERLDSIVPLEAVLNGVRQSGLRPHIVLLSSAAVYGEPGVLPVDEATPLRPISPYGRSKLECEQLLNQFSMVADVRVTIARIFSVFGEGQKRLLIWDLFQKFRDEKIVSLFGTGEEMRDFIYIGSLADQLLTLARIKEGCGPVNVGYGVGRTVKEVASTMAAILGSRKRIDFTGEAREGDPKRWQADIGRFEKLTESKVPDAFVPSLERVLAAWR